MLRALLAVIAVVVTPPQESSKDWQDDPHAPWVIGSWKLSCRRDGNFSGWNYVERCGASQDLGDQQLWFTRSANEAGVSVDAITCSVSVPIPLARIRNGAPSRARVLRHALERALIDIRDAARPRAASLCLP
jgi:hypothetical protein